MKRIRMTTIAVAITAMLGGCSLAPTYHKPSVPTPTQWGEASDWQQVKLSDTPIQGDWWQQYNDPVLNGLIGKLDQHNPDLDAAVAHYQQIAAVAQQVAAAELPTVGLAGSQTDNKAYYNKPQIGNTFPDTNIGKDPQTYREQVGGIGFSSFELDLWGRVRNLAEESRDNALAAQADMEGVRLSLRSLLATTYILMREYDAQTELLETLVKSYEQAQVITENRFRGGVDSALSVSRARAQLDSARAQLEDVMEKRALFEHQIATLVGQPASSFHIARDQTRLQMPQIPLEMPAQMLERRPDIAAAERRVAAANAGIGVAKAAWFPVFSFSAFTGVDALIAQNFMAQPASVWSLGPAMAFTLFDNGRRRALNDQALATFRYTSDNYRSVTLKAFQEVEDDLVRLNDLKREEQEVTEAVKDTARTEQIAWNRYKEGMVNYLEVVTAQTDAQRAQIQANDVRARRLRASVELIKALGGGYQQVGSTAADMPMVPANKTNG